jgi:predicted nucleic acid-binding protein
MIFDDLAAGAAVFLDASTLIYHFTNHPQYGAACTRLVERIEQKDLQGIISAHVLADVSHRLMTIEAMNRFGWPAAGLAARLRKHRTEIPKLVLYQQAVAKVPQLGIQTVPVSEALIVAANVLSQKHELLTGDALIVAVMQQHGLPSLASTDTDFDVVPGLTRYTAP